MTSWRDRSHKYHPNVSDFFIWLGFIWIQISVSIIGPYFFQNRFLAQNGRQLQVKLMHISNYTLVCPCIYRTLSNHITCLIRVKNTRSFIHSLIHVSHVPSTLYSSTNKSNKDNNNSNICNKNLNIWITIKSNKKTHRFWSVAKVAITCSESPIYAPPPCIHNIRYANRNYICM